MRFAQFRRRRGAKSTFENLLASLRQPDDTDVNPEPWRVHGTTRHRSFKEDRRGIERRQERRFVRRIRESLICTD